MKLVIDTNIIISALIREGLTRKMLLFPGIKLITPEITFNEIKNHIGIISTKSKLPEDNVQQILDILIKNIVTTSFLRSLVNYQVGNIYPSIYY
jgi:predicted nucleic acid-binding protein